MCNTHFNDNHSKTKTLLQFFLIGLQYYVSQYYEFLNNYYYYDYYTKSISILAQNLSNPGKGLDNLVIFFKRKMLTNILKVFVKNLFKESFYEKMKKKNN